MDLLVAGEISHIPYSKDFVYTMKCTTYDYYAFAFSQVRPLYVTIILCWNTKTEIAKVLWASAL